MQRAIVEEVEDSDLENSDPAEEDIDDFSEADILRTRPTGGGGGGGALSSFSKPKTQPISSSSSSSFPQPQHQALRPGEVDPSIFKSHRCLYPVYFDARRTRAQGRRVSASLAVASPLAVEIAHACSALGLAAVIEAARVHPKDWANPGRVRVDLSDTGAARAAGIKNKHHLYVLVADHLRRHPVALHPDTGLLLGAGAAAAHMRMAGGPGAVAPPPDEPWPRPAVPRGWKIGDVLPYYSPALTGGGVSDNFFQDMMREMQAGGGPGGGGGGGGGFPGMPPGMELPPGMEGMASMLGGMGGMMGGGGGASGSGGGEGKGKKERKGRGRG